MKYYDEFLFKILRREVEEIGGVILKEVNKIEEGFGMVIVGGYRRGKKELGDVDVVFLYWDEEVMRGFVERIVVGLERRGYIIYMLLFSMVNMEWG